MKKKLCYEDLGKMSYLSAPAADNKAERIAYVEARAVDDGSFEKHIYLIDLKNTNLEDEAKAKPEKQLLCEASSDLPAFSPDGKSLAYLRTGISKPQIWLYDFETSSHRQLSTQRHGVESFLFSPDGKRLAFCTYAYPDDGELWNKELSLEESEALSYSEEHEPIVVENLIYKLDECYGIRGAWKRRIGVVDLESGKTELLTDKTIDSYMPVWQKDGKALIYYGRPHTHKDELKAEIFRVFIDDELHLAGSEELKCGRDIEDSDPVLVTSDNEVIFASYEGKNGGASLKLYAKHFGKGSYRELFPKKELCHGVDSYPIGRTAYGHETPNYQLSEEGDFVYFRSGKDGCENIFRVGLKKKTLEPVLLGKMSVHSHLAPISGKLIYTRGDLLTPAELYVAEECEDSEGSLKEMRLTFSNEWLNEYELSKPVELWARSYDKKAKIHGFLMKPMGYEEGKKYPAVLDIHGGPSCFYAYDFWFEFQMLAARGFAVVYCDPRGSFGYGTEFSKSDYCWGNESMDDLYAFLDRAEKEGFIDKHRVGVTGGSYGGHMTLRIIGSSRRFKAACAQRPLVNLATSYGTGDMGFIWKKEGMQTQMENFMYRIDRSPIRKIDSMKTPLLILQGEKDYRCSMEQSEQLFIAMKDRNPEIPVRLVIFPGENHGVTRTGKLHFQVAHLRELCEWFVRFLIEDPEKSGKEA